jgi:hypothetical protein
MVCLQSAEKFRNRCDDVPMKNGAKISSKAILSSCVYTLTRKIADITLDPAQLVSSLAMADSDIVGWLKNIYDTPAVAAASITPALEPPSKKQKLGDQEIQEFERFFNKLASEDSEDISLDDIHDGVQKLIVVRSFLFPNKA